MYFHELLPNRRMDGDWEAQSSYADPTAVFLLGFHPAWKWTGRCASVWARHRERHTSSEWHERALSVVYSNYTTTIFISHIIGVIVVVIYVNYKKLVTEKPWLKVRCGPVWDWTICCSLLLLISSRTWSTDVAMSMKLKSPLGGTIGLPLT